MVQVVAGKAVACLFCGCTIPESPFFGVFCQVRTHQGVFGEFLVSRYLALFQTFGLLLFPSILAGEKHPILTNIFEFLCLMISSHFSFRASFLSDAFFGAQLATRVVLLGQLRKCWPLRSSSRWAEKLSEVPNPCGSVESHTPIRDEENILLCESLPDRCGWTGITIYP